MMKHLKIYCLYWTFACLVFSVRQPLLAAENPGGEIGPLLLRKWAEIVSSQCVRVEFEYKLYFGDKKPIDNLYAEDKYGYILYDMKSGFYRMELENKTESRWAPLGSYSIEAWDGDKIVSWGMSKKSNLNNIAPEKPGVATIRHGATSSQFNLISRMLGLSAFGDAWSYVAQNPKYYMHQEGLEDKNGKKLLKVNLGPVDIWLDPRSGIILESEWYNDSKKKKLFEQRTVTSLTHTELVDMPSAESMILIDDNGEKKTYEAEVKKVSFEKSFSGTSDERLKINLPPGVLVTEDGIVKGYISTPPGSGGNIDVETRLNHAVDEIKKNANP